MCIKCIPRNKPGKPKANRTSDKEKEDASGDVVECYKKTGKKRGMPRDSAAVALSSISSTHAQAQHASLFSDLRFHKEDPRAYAASYIRVIQNLLAQGRASRDRLLWLCNGWNDISFLAGCDVTWGLKKEVAKMLNFTQAEIEGGLEMVVLSPSPQERKRLTELKLEKAVAKSRQVRETERVRALVKREEMNGRRVRVAVLSMSPSSYVYMCNAAYKGFFRHPAEALDDYVETAPAVGDRGGRDGVCSGACAA